MKATISTLLFACLMAMASYCHAATDTFRIYFRTGITVLDEGQRKSLDSFIYNTSIGAGAGLGIVGYADEPGTTALNKSLGQKRALSVRDYLLRSGLPKQNIEACIGKGNLAETGEDAFERRVDIVLGFRHAAETSASTTAPPVDSLSGIEALATMKPGEVLVLEGLQFAVSTASFMMESYPVLQRLTAVLKAHPAVRVNIEGHICCGTPLKEGMKKEDDPFFTLSEDRAQAVFTYLKKHGIEAGRLSYEGFGFSKPRVYPERSERDRFRNRRVELRVTG
jgi:outer membrane protein OmpA-like peptidoglycan-associated protein